MDNNPHLIIAIHFDCQPYDVEKIQDVIDRLQQSFDDIKHVDVLSNKDYHADVGIQASDRLPSDDEQLTEYYEQQRRNRRYEEADTDD